MDYPNKNLPAEGLHTASGTHPVVYWTFDDGPHPELTPRLLDWLEEHSVSAILFVTGQRAEKYPSVVKDAYRRGFLVGNHTWSHPRMGKLSRQRVFDEISRTQNLLADLVGSRPLFYRQSFHKPSLWQNEICRELRLFPIFGDCWAGDFRGDIQVQDIVDSIEKSVKKGSILGFHEMYPVTIESLDRINQILLEKGLSAGDPVDLIPR